MVQCRFKVQPPPPGDPRLTDPFHLSYDPMAGRDVPTITLPPLVDAAAQATSAEVQARLTADYLDPYSGWNYIYDPYDPYNSAIDPYGPAALGGNMPPIGIMLDQLAIELPMASGMTEEFTSSKLKIIAIATGIIPPLPEGSDGSSIVLSVDQAAEALSLSFTFIAYTSLSLYLTIASVVCFFGINITLNIALPFMNIIALAMVAVQLLTLFSQEIAGIMVLVKLGIKDLMKLLASLIPACFLGLFALLLNLPLIVAMMGVNITINFSFVKSSVRRGVIASLGLPASSIAGASAAAAAAAAAAAGGADDSMADPYDPCELNSPAGSAGAGTASAPSVYAAPGGGFGTGYRAPTLAQLVGMPYDEDTLMNLLAPDQLSPIKNATINETRIFNDRTRPRTMREVINNAPACEEAVRSLFDYLLLPYDKKITLCELILLAADFSAGMPVDITNLQLIAGGLPHTVRLITPRIIAGLDFKPIPCSILIRNEPQYE